VESAREMRDKVERETRFYITSLTLPASQMGSIVRNHWAVESAPQAHEQGGSYDLTDCAQAAREMKGGPSESAFRSRLQTTSSCCGKEPWWCCVMKARKRHAVREMKEDPSEPPCRRRLQTAMSGSGQKPRS